MKNHNPPYRFGQVQEAASSAVSWCCSRGGAVGSKDLVNRLAGAGTSGKHPGNTERDCQTLIKTFGKRMGVAISNVRARMWDPHYSRVVEKYVPCILPDDMATGLWHVSKQHFHSCLLGDTDAGKFWQHCYQHCEWFKKHPASSNSSWEKMVPLNVYGDEIQAYRNSECGSISVLAWSSDLAATNSFLNRYWLITAYSEHEESAYTYSDLMEAVVQRVTSMVTPRTERANQYAWEKAGYTFMMSSLQGDLKWVYQHYGGLHNYHMNDFCGHCNVAKVHGELGMTAGDFRHDALYRQTSKRHSQSQLEQSRLARH